MIEVLENETEDLVEVCRLCMKHDGIKVPIFGEDGSQDVALKIQHCFSHMVYQTDPFPKLICHKCLFKLEQCYEFRSEVFSAFERMKKKFAQRSNGQELTNYLSAHEQQVINLESESEDGRVQLSATCSMCSEDSVQELYEGMEIVKHSPFLEIPNLDQQDAEHEINRENEKACMNDGNEMENFIDNATVADTEEIAGNKNYRTKIMSGTAESFSKQQQNKPSGQGEELLVNTSVSVLPKGSLLQWCNFCQKYLKNRKQFNRHNRVIHSKHNDTLYACKCKRKFHTLCEMLIHQQCHLRVQIKFTENKLLKCDLCDKKFADHSILNAHLITHDVGYRRRPSFKSHIVRKCRSGNLLKESSSDGGALPELDILVCHHCRMIFQTARSLSSHLRFGYCFLTCKSSFSGESQGGKKRSACHERKHPQIETSGYNITLQNTVTSSNMSSNTPQQTANILTKLFKKESGLDTKNSAIALGNQCSVCDKVYSSQHSLKRHQKTHFSLQPVNFSCSFCDRIFDTRASIISHLKTHAYAERYHCQYCRKEFMKMEPFHKHECLVGKEYPVCNLKLSYSTSVLHKH